MTGGEALRAVLDALGVSQSAFSTDAGISAKHLNQLIQGHANFTPETVALIADGVAIRLMSIDTKHRLKVLRAIGGHAVEADIYVCPDHNATGGYESCCECGGWHEDDPDKGRLCTEASE